MAKATRKDKTGRERKTERIELRIVPSVKAVIRRAMAISGLAAGDLAYEGARRLIVEHERMALTGADRDVFLEAVRNPPAPSRRLVKALRREREILR